MSAGKAKLCEHCKTRPLSLTSRGKLRKDKRFCGVACQQAAIRTKRVTVRKDTQGELVEALERLCLEASHFRDTGVGEPFLTGAIQMARAALEKARKS